MLTNRTLIFGLLCLGFVASCTSPSEMDSIAPTNAVTAFVEPTPTVIELPNKITVLSNGKVKFDNWNVYVTFPEDWDINPEVAYDLGFNTESYLFWGHGITTKDGYFLQPQASFQFHPFHTNSEISTYLTDKLPDANELEYEFDKSYSPKEIGLNLDSAMVQQGKFADSPCYVIRAIHKDFGIEIRMFANFRIFPEVEQQFLEIIRSISVEN